MQVLLVKGLAILWTEIESWRPQSRFMRCMGCPVDLDSLQCSPTPASLGCVLDPWWVPVKWSVGTCGRVQQFHSAHLSFSLHIGVPLASSLLFSWSHQGASCHNHDRVPCRWQLSSFNSIRTFSFTFISMSFIDFCSREITFTPRGVQAFSHSSLTPLT